MSNHQQSAGLVQTWVTGTDSQGRTRLEAQWTDGSSAPATHVTHAA